MDRAKVNVQKDLSAWQGICVVGEQKFGVISPTTFELLGEAKKLAETKDLTVEVIVLGNDMDEEITELSLYGADKVTYFQHELLKDYTTEAYTKVLCEYIAKIKPEALLVGATAIGRDLAPRMAARLGTGLTADCTEIQIDSQDGKFLYTKPAFGGNLMATIVCSKNRPQMSTVRPGVMNKAQKVQEKSEINKITPDIDASDILAKVIKIVKEKKNIPSLVDAEVIVAGGRGVGSKEGFAILRELAEVMGGEVAASRAAIDNGWITSECQIGQTGTTVKPKIYIACGISGAIQHIAGMQDSQCIISINKNSDAPINKIAHYSIIGDMFAVIPELLALLK